MAICPAADPPEQAGAYAHTVDYMFPAMPNGASLDWSANHFAVSRAIESDGMAIESWDIPPLIEPVSAGDGIRA